MFAMLSSPIDAALKEGNVTIGDIDAVEMIGGAWRIPKVQTLLSEHILKSRPEGAVPLNLSQHVNGEEAMATGAAFFGANSSTSFRVKRIFFTDFSQHDYRLVLKPIDSSQDMH